MCHFTTFSSSKLFFWNKAENLFPQFWKKKQPQNLSCQIQDHLPEAFRLNGVKPVSQQCRRRKPRRADFDLSPQHLSASDLL